MSDQERVVYPYGTSGRGYRVNHRTFVCYRLVAGIGVVASLLLLVSAAVLHRNFVFFTGMGLLLLTFAAQLVIARFGRLPGEPVYMDFNQSRSARVLVPLHRTITKVSVAVLAILVSLSVWQTVRTGQEISFDQEALIVLVLFGIVAWRGIGSKRSNRPRPGEE